MLHAQTALPLVLPALCRTDYGLPLLLLHSRMPACSSKVMCMQRLYSQQLQEATYHAPVQRLLLSTCHAPVQLMGQGLVLLQACSTGAHTIHAYAGQLHIRCVSKHSSAVVLLLWQAPRQL